MNIVKITLRIIPILLLYSCASNQLVSKKNKTVSIVVQNQSELKSNNILDIDIKFEVINDTDSLIYLPKPLNIDNSYGFINEPEFFNITYLNCNQDVFFEYQSKPKNIDDFINIPPNSSVVLEINPSIFDEWSCKFESGSNARIKIAYIPYDSLGMEQMAKDMLKYHSKNQEKWKEIYKSMLQLSIDSEEIIIQIE